MWSLYKKGIRLILIVKVEKKEGDAVEKCSVLLSFIYNSGMIN